MENNIIEELLNSISLEGSIIIYLQMSDYDNWKDGKYYGCVDNEVNDLLEIVDSWMKTKAPLREKDGMFQLKQTNSEQLI